MKNKFLLICTIILTIFIAGCSKNEINFESELPSDYMKVKIDYLGSVTSDGLNYLLMNDLQIKCSDNDLELITMGRDIFDIEIIYKTLDREYELIDYRFVKEDGTIINTKNKDELNSFILKEIDYPEDGTYENDFTVTEVDKMVGFTSNEKGDYYYLIVKVTNDKGKEIKFLSKSNETKNYLNVQKLSVGQKIHFVYRTERDNTYSPYGVNYIIINFK